MKLLFAGDVVMGGVGISVSQRLKEAFSGADARICNFEGAIPADKSEKIVKAGPHVKNDASSIAFLKSLAIDYAALANNHSMDYGLSALENTVRLLAADGIQTFGAGRTFEEAYRPLVVVRNGEEVCVVNACQAEFGVLKDCEYRGGYSWVGSRRFKELVTECSVRYPKTILFLHAGMEGQPVPLPEWKSLYHELADILAGKGAIIAAHPHIVQGYETYNGTPIFYSLGNFSFYKADLEDDEDWNRGLCVQYDTVTNAVKVIPVSTKNRMLDVDESESFAKVIAERCALCADDKRLRVLADGIAEESWNGFYKSYYLHAAGTKNIGFYSSKQLVKIIIKRMLNRLFKTNFVTDMDEPFDETMLLHNIQIETHRFCCERYLYNQNIRRNNLRED